MNKSEIIQKMSQSVDGSMFIGIADLARFMGLKNNTRVKKEFCSGLDRVGKSYFIPDVVDQILRQRGI